ncbi:MAG TPA: FUSC family protein [Burkholderiales bacterium]|nr:FUSC family protein [Burkholderiales bacterium]
MTTLEFLRAELAPAPGRLHATIRVVVATMIVLATSMTLEVPEIALSLFIVLFITMMVPGVSTQNSVFVAIGGIIAIIALTVALATTMLVYRFTMDYPPLRLAAMALGFFVGIYLSRVFVLGAAGWVFAFIVLVTQAYVDIFPGPEATVRAILWVWVVIAYPAVLAIALGLLLLPADPEPLLRRELAARRDAVARALKAPPGSDEAKAAAAALIGFMLQGAAPLQKLLHLAGIKDSAMKARHAEISARIDYIQDLVASAARLGDLAPEAAAAERERIGGFLAQGAAPSAGEHAAEHAEKGAKSGPGPFVADAFSNPRYVQFALKVTLTAMLCYVTYTALDWPGIHTCMMTCAIIALGSAGATMHKGTLRLIGVAIGGTLALFAIVFIVPHITSLPALMLVVAPVTALGAWVAMGNERTAYIGLQIAFSFYLAVLQDFAPSTDVTEFRDRIVGVILAIAVMALVFTWVWPERAASSMVESLRTALGRLKELAAGTANPRAVRAAAWQSLADAEHFAELAAFEAETTTSAGAAHRRRIIGLIDRTKRALLLQPV